MPTPIVPPKVNQWINSPQSRATTTQFPLNLCAVLDGDLQKKILDYVNRNYVWPQVQERAPFEGMWDAVLDMYRIKLKKIDSKIKEDSPAGRDLKKEGGDTVQASDSVIHDAVERLTDVSHFVMYKEGLPVQFIIPPYYDNRMADQFYDPMRDRITAANALLQWNHDNEDIYRKAVVALRHFYLYGISFVRSEFAFECEPITQMNNMGQQVVTSQFKRLGTTFDPISIRKLWLNFRLTADMMDYQPCPFFCEETPRWAVIASVYDPDKNPFGYFNQNLIPAGGAVDGWMYGSQEMQSMRTALEGMVNAIKPGTGSAQGLGIASLLNAEHSVEQLWTLYPMLPLDEQTGEWEFRQTTAPDGKSTPTLDANGAKIPVPFKRFVMNTFGQNFVGKQVLLRLQRNYYPKDKVPIYASNHMPDLDSGMYTPSVGFLLQNHFNQLTSCISQYLTNKDWINNPPSWHSVSSPAANEEINTPGARIPVLGPNDFGWREPFDATGSTAAVMELLRGQAKETSKSTDALMGQAMGSRTSATEASNAFQASMSAVTTPINIFGHDIFGGFASRVWDYAAMWMPPAVLKELTGQMGFAISPEDMWLMAGMRTNTGSTYIESIVRQQQIQYVIQTGAQDPSLNHTELWKMLFREMKFPNAEDIVNDNGFDLEVQKATEQAINTFNGIPVIISPDQNHAIALRVKTRFLEDQDSVWMTQHRQFAPLLVQQIQQHQAFLMLQMQQQLAHAQAGMPIPVAGPNPVAGANPPAPPQLMQNGGAAAHVQGQS